MFFMKYSLNPHYLDYLKRSLQRQKLTAMGDPQPECNREHPVVYFFRTFSDSVRKQRSLQPCICQSVCSFLLSLIPHSCGIDTAENVALWRSRPRGQWPGPSGCAVPVPRAPSWGGAHSACRSAGKLSHSWS